MGYFNASRQATSATIDAGLMVTGVGGAVRSTSGFLARGLSTIGRESVAFSSPMAQIGAVGDLSLLRTGGSAAGVAEEVAALRRIAAANATPEARALHARINERAGIAGSHSPTVVVQGSPLRPGGYVIHDVDLHGNLSPGVNRAPGFSGSSADGLVQSHHPVQVKWAETNVPGYDKNLAPSILLKTSRGEPHALINSAQRVRRAELRAQGVNPYGTSIRQEFQVSYRELIDAGVPPAVARKAMIDNYKYFDSLGAF